jgi:quercetin dioxygenase-like cupin family protein
MYISATRTLKATVLSLSMFAAGDVWAEEQPLVTVSPNGSQPSSKGPAQFFTGNVRVDGAFKGTGAARVSGGTVTFEPGARSVWHTHPLGQTLIVTAGMGRVQQEGQPMQVIRAGDTVWIPPNVRHWHGATPTTGMTHVAIFEALDGKVVDWMEQVSDTQYNQR